MRALVLVAALLLVAGSVRADGSYQPLGRFDGADVGTFTSGNYRCFIAELAGNVALSCVEHKP